MRIIGRLILFTFAFIAILAAALYVARGPVLGAGLRYALKRSGFEAASLTVREVSADQLVLSDIAFGGRDDAPGVLSERVAVKFDWRRLLRDRQVNAIEIGPSIVRIDINDSGGFSVAGRAFGGDGSESTGPIRAPADLIFVEALRLNLTNEAGEVATAEIDGAFDVSKGAAFDGTVNAERFAYGEVTLTDLTGEGALRLVDDGDIILTSMMSTDIETPQGAIQDFDLAIEGNGRSWRAALENNAPISGALDIDVRSGEIAVDQAPALSALLDEEARRLSTEKARVLSVQGGVRLALDQGALTVTALEDAGLIVSSNRGDRLSITSLDNQPFYSAADGVDMVGAAVNLVGPGMNGSVSARATRVANDDWRFSFQSAVVDPALDGVRLGATSLDATGVLGRGRLTSILDVATTVTRADVGRLSISDAPFSAALEVDALLDDETLTVSITDDRCVVAERGAFRLAGQDMAASIRGASLCEGDAPLLRFLWGDNPQARLHGRLKVRRGDYRLGETTMKGAPPWIDFSAFYEPAAHQTTVEGSFGNGAVSINDELLGTDVSGAFTASLANDALSADIAVDEVTITQAAETKQLAPLIGTGAGRLADDVFRFDYEVKTEKGAQIGGGEGRHEVLSGEGEAVFRSPSLAFVPGGLQPTEISPVLKGIMTDTVGTADVEALASWSGGGAPLKTSGVMRLQGVTFQGPGIAVSQTRGMSGEIALSNLMPPATAGPQTITLDGVDLSALVLENGEVTFELPGDESLRVLKAEFPWFGGTIGAYETVASVAGDRAVTRLQAANVNLSEMLEFLDIEGLSGEGIVEGVLPLVVEEGLASIEGGVMTAVGPGVVRYAGAATQAASSASNEANIAFDLLRNLRFNKLRAEIDGPLDGDIQFKLLFEGTNEVNLNDPRVTEPVTSPVIYRISLEAPLLTLVNNARTSADPNFLVGRARDIRVERAKRENEAAEPQ
ncbi:MAG: YdbH domain-containing protein [Pseudomonadota bacterium]